MRQFGTALTAFIICLLSMGASYEARAQVSLNTQYDWVDTASTFSSVSAPCTNQVQCSSIGTEQGTYTNGQSTATAGLNEQTIGTFTSKPLVELSPTMSAGSSLSATAAPPDTGFAPGVGIDVTGQWQIPFGVNDLKGISGLFNLAPPQALTGGTLEWSNTFTNFSGGASSIQYTFNVSGGSGSSAINDTALLDLACVSVGCTATFQSDGVDYFGPFQNPSFTVSLSLGDNWDSSIPLTLSETVVVGSFTGLAPSTNGFSFDDPITLTYLDANGNVVPNLVFYNSDLNAIMPLSGQEFTPVSDTPLPAGLPLFATGLGALGLLG